MTDTILCPRRRHGRFPPEGSPPAAYIAHYWDGRKAPGDLIAEVRCAWSPRQLHFHFSAAVAELNVNEAWPRDRSVQGLWKCDVVEIFLRPSGTEVYFELEVSPLGQWFEALVRTPRVDVDLAWRSGALAECEIDAGRLWRAGLAIPFEPMMNALEMNLPPEVGDVWEINLFRVSGAEPWREYLAWQPTFTPRPDFHVPGAFGRLVLAE